MIKSKKCAGCRKLKGQVAALFDAIKYLNRTHRKFTDTLKFPRL